MLDDMTESGKMIYHWVTRRKEWPTTKENEKKRKKERNKGLLPSNLVWHFAGYGSKMSEEVTTAEVDKIYYVSESGRTGSIEMSGNASWKWVAETQKLPMYVAFKKELTNI